MDENIVKFQEKLRELVSLGKKKKGILEIQEINDFFSDMELDSDQMEKVFDYLEANNVDVLRISNDDDDIPDKHGYRLHGRFAENEHCDRKSKENGSAAAEKE